MAITIYHNPRCSKSRQTLELIRNRGIEPEIVHYLETPPTADELKTILKKLAMAAVDIVREKEAREEGIDARALDENELIEALVQHPRAIERPIVVTTLKARIGRPPENVLEIL